MASSSTFSKTNSLANNTQQLRIGSNESGGTSQYFTGTIDEVRISNTARSPDWIKAEYLSQADNLVSIGTAESRTTTFTYDGDGNRVKQVITGGNTTLYINKYFEKDLTSGNITSYYYLGGRLVAMKQGSANVTYVHQDNLGGTSVVSNANGALVSSISYAPFGDSRNSQGVLGTDRLFTGQRLDSTGCITTAPATVTRRLGGLSALTLQFQKAETPNRITGILIA